MAASDPIEGLDVARLDELRDLEEGDTSYLDRAIGNFQRNSVDAMATIRSALERGELPAAKAAAHKIAGSALNLGVIPAGDGARTLEVEIDEAIAAPGSAPVADLLTTLAALAETMAAGRARLLDYQATYHAPNR